MMMNILIVTAHPSTQGTTHKIANTYADTKRKQGHQVEIISLYDKQWRQEYFSFENIKDVSADPIRDARQKKITDADEIVLVFPVWRADCPAIMKNRLDSNFAANFAFRYTEKMPEGLLKDKQARLFMTCDGPGRIYKLFPVSFKRYWKLFRLGFCGIKVRSVTIFDTMRNRKKKSQGIENILQKVEKVADRK